jgi:hypothetical protein
MQFKEKPINLVLRGFRASLLLSGEPGTTVWVSISTLSLFESTGLLTLSKHLSLSGISDLRIFISCFKSVDGRNMIHYQYIHSTFSAWLQIISCLMIKHEASLCNSQQILFFAKMLQCRKWSIHIWKQAARTWECYHRTGVYAQKCAHISHANINVLATSFTNVSSKKGTAAVCEHGSSPQQQCTGGHVTLPAYRSNFVEVANNTYMVC